MNGFRSAESENQRLQEVNESLTSMKRQLEADKEELEERLGRGGSVTSEEKVILSTTFPEEQPGYWKVYFPIAETSGGQDSTVGDRARRGAGQFRDCCGQAPKGTIAGNICFWIMQLGYIDLFHLYAGMESVYVQDVQVFHKSENLLYRTIK